MGGKGVREVTAGCYFGNSTMNDNKEHVHVSGDDPTLQEEQKRRCKH